eukprot:2485260-Rhodomonas_salina.1
MGPVGTWASCSVLSLSQSLSRKPFPMLFNVQTSGFIAQGLQGSRVRLGGREGREARVRRNLQLVHGPRCMVQGSRIRAGCSGLRVHGLEFRVHGLETSSAAEATDRAWGGAGIATARSTAFKGGSRAYGATSSWAPARTATRYWNSPPCATHVRASGVHRPAHRCAPPSTQ